MKSLWPYQPNTASLKLVPTSPLSCRIAVCTVSTHLGRNSSLLADGDVQLTASSLGVEVGSGRRRGGPRTEHKVGGGSESLRAPQTGTQPDL